MLQTANVPRDPGVRIGQIGYVYGAIVVDTDGNMSVFDFFRRGVAKLLRIWGRIHRADPRSISTLVIEIQGQNKVSCINAGELVSS